MGPVRRLAILGSTGSIGTQALDVVRKFRDRFEIVALVARANAEALAEQTDEFAPDLAVLVEGESDGPFRTGWDGVLEAARHADADLVLNALVGSRGLGPTLAALDAGKVVALANKESLVAGGDLVMGRGTIIPVDSEHAAIAQCLEGRTTDEVRRIILTASGGPFRGRARASLADVTVEEALNHPTWRMGPKITIDSATLMNKGLEVIEAHHLFTMAPERIDVVVHPTSVVHGIVEFVDGSSVLAAAAPDMRLPIQAALTHPERVAGAVEPVAWDGLTLDFAPVDHDAFGAIGLARAAVRAGGSAPAVLNAANEEAVGAFLAGGIGFLRITEVVEEVLAAHDVIPIDSLETVMAVETWARTRAQEIMTA
jgi:1-deoxy-D-xylulose-5-phosphate reductoisomerase